MTENECPGHVASPDSPKVCAHCGTHIDELRPEPEDANENGGRLVPDHASGPRDIIGRDCFGRAITG